MAHLYFAYGSNLDREQMRERCPDAEPFRLAHLPDYRLAFGGHSSSWKGATATVVPFDGNEVPGLLYRIGEEDLLALDGYEGHPQSYQRRLEYVVDLDGERHEAQIYIKAMETKPFEVPPEGYMEVLKAAYEELGFEQKRLERAADLGRADG